LYCSTMVVRLPFFVLQHYGCHFLYQLAVEMEKGVLAMGVSVGSTQPSPVCCPSRLKFRCIEIVLCLAAVMVLRSDVMASVPSLPWCLLARVCSPQWGCSPSARACGEVGWCLLCLPGGRVWCLCCQNHQASVKMGSSCIGFSDLFCCARM
jgi:hypothetical protein